MTLIGRVPQPIPAPQTQEELIEWAQSVLLKTLRVELTQLRQAINNLALENMDWKLVEDVGFITADSDVTVTHNLGRVPVFAIPFIKEDLGAIGAGSHTTIYKGTGAWTATTLTLQSTRGLTSPGIQADILVL